MTKCFTCYNCKYFNMETRKCRNIHAVYRKEAPNLLNCIHWRYVGDEEDLRRKEFLNEANRHD